MKIAVVTDDLATVCPHFGRATHYLVYTIEEDRIVAREVRSKAGHHTADADRHNGCRDHGNTGEHQTRHRDGGHHADAGARHRDMVATIADCERVIAAGMGTGARTALQAAGITPCLAALHDAEEAVHAYLIGVRMGEPTC